MKTSKRSKNKNKKNGKDKMKISKTDYKCYIKKSKEGNVMIKFKEREILKNKNRGKMKWDQSRWRNSKMIKNPAMLKKWRNICFWNNCKNRRRRMNSKKDQYQGSFHNVKLKEKNFKQKRSRKHNRNFNSKNKDKNT